MQTGSAIAIDQGGGHQIGKQRHRHAGVLHVGPARSAAPLMQVIPSHRQRRQQRAAAAAYLPLRRGHAQNGGLQTFSQEGRGVHRQVGVLEGGTHAVEGVHPASSWEGLHND